MALAPGSAHKRRLSRGDEDADPYHAAPTPGAASSVMSPAKVRSCTQCQRGHGDAHTRYYFATTES